MNTDSPYMAIHCHICGQRLGYSDTPHTPATFLCDECMSKKTGQVVEVKKITETHYIVNGFHAKITKSNTPIILVNIEGTEFKVPHQLGPTGNLIPMEARALIINAAHQYMHERSGGMSYIYNSSMDTMNEPWTELIAPIGSTVTTLLERVHDLKGDTDNPAWDMKLTDMVYLKYIQGEKGILTVIGVL